MFIALIIVHVLCSIALILIVLLQAGKGAGISNVFGGSGQTVFGARTGDVLARGTEICAGLFMVTSLGLAMMSSDRSSSVMRKRPAEAPPAGMPLAPAQQAAVDKMKEAFAGIAKTVKQAATTAASGSQQPAQSQPTAPAQNTPAAPAAPTATPVEASETTESSSEQPAQ